MTTRDFTMIADDELKAQAEKLYNSGFKVGVVNSQLVLIHLDRKVSLQEVYQAMDASTRTMFHLRKSIYGGVVVMTEAEAARLRQWWHK